MKYLATLLLIVSFAGMGIFGFSLFDHAMMDGSNSGCVASAIDGTACPTSIMSMTLHHISALQTLTTTVVPPISVYFYCSHPCFLFRFRYSYSIKIYYFQNWGYCLSVYEI